MSMPDDAPIQGTEMSEAEIDEFLRTRGTGVLSLADGGAAYGVPLSFGYDGENVYFVLVHGETSRKVEVGERTERASLTVYDVEGKHRWRSVIAEGPLEEIPDGEWDHAVETVGDNAWYPSAFSEAEPMQGFVGWALRIETVSGRKDDR